MIKTAKEIQGDVLASLKQSNLAAMISGGVYRQGYRPRDSRKEDAVVIFTTGESSEIQSGMVTVNIFVPDADYGHGYLEENGQRTQEIEIAAQQWVDSMSAGYSCYRFRQNGAIHTNADNSILQHFVVVKLNYKYFDNFKKR